MNGIRTFWEWAQGIRNTLGTVGNCIEGSYPDSGRQGFCPSSRALLVRTIRAGPLATAQLGLLHGRRDKGKNPALLGADQPEKQTGREAYSYIVSSPIAKISQRPAPPLGLESKRRLKEVTLPVPLRGRPRVPERWAKVRQLERENGFSRTHLLIA